MRNNKKSIILTTLSIILGLGISLGAIYFIYHIHDESENNLSSGLISLKFTEGNNNIDLLTVPMIDDEGLKTNPYEFQLENTSAIPINAIIKLDLNNSTNIDLRAVRYAIFIDDKMVLKDYVHDNLILYEKENMVSGEVLNFKVYFWVDYYYDKPGKVFSAKVVAEGKSIDAIATEPITVTFDPNGGTLETTTKEVYYHGYYGELPTPTKEGYTFMGWNGKNMFNDDEAINDCYIYSGNGNFEPYVGNPPWNCSDYIEIEGGKTYTFNPNSSSGNNDTSHSVYNNEKTFIESFTSGMRTINMPQNAKYIRISYRRNNSSNIQLEESTVATEYEPYYITRDTKVVQNSNHTLKAIWKENE